MFKITKIIDVNTGEEKDLKELENCCIYIKFLEEPKFNRPLHILYETWGGTFKELVTSPIKEVREERLTDADDPNNVRFISYVITTKENIYYIEGNEL